jgi:hypothetical protein
MISLKVQRLCLAIAPAVIAALAVAGCGGSDDDGTTAPASLTKAQYVKQADAVCAKTEGRQQLLVKKFSEKGLKQSAATEVKLVVFAGIPPLVTQAEELAAIPLPSSGADEAQAFVKAFEAGVKEAEAKPAALLNLETNPFTKAESLARKYGLQVCRGA